MDDQQIQTIINRVMREIGQGTPPTVAAAPLPSRSVPLPEPPAGQLGLFDTLDEAVAAATHAFRRLQQLPLAIRQDMVAQMRQTGRENAAVLAEMAHSETGMGRVEDKIVKNILNATKTPGPKASPPRPGAATTASPLSNTPRMASLGR